jgi:hypothetical protein
VKGKDFLWASTYLVYGVKIQFEVIQFQLRLV